MFVFCHVCGGRRQLQFLSERDVEVELETAPTVVTCSQSSSAALSQNALTFAAETPSSDDNIEDFDDDDIW